nr:MAG TPA: hypothetical protein [Caudoviricetes sp.]
MLGGRIRQFRPLKTVLKALFFVVVPFCFCC